jgi:hypothetical protein
MQNVSNMKFSIKDYLLNWGRLDGGRSLTLCKNEQIE